MGIKNLLKELPGGNSLTDTIHGFDNLHLLRDRKNKVDLDAGTLVFVSALRNRETYSQGIYKFAAAEFQRELMCLVEVYRWDIRVIFDGKPPTEKRFEHARRRDREDGVEITSLFIAFCIEVCKVMCVPYMVAAGEADVQVGKQRDGAIAATRDSDLLAYGNKRVILIDNYGSR